MSALRVFVCDDEPLAVSRLTSLLSRLPDVEVVGSAHDADGALLDLADARPDLLLLDIEMPGLDGFDLAEQLRSRHRSEAPVPVVAFVTAFRRFAPEAFDCGAVDFLSKPVRLTRLEQTLARARLAIDAREAAGRLADLEAALDRLRDHADARRDAHVWVTRRHEAVRVDLDKVSRVTAEGAYVRLHVEATSFLHREAIGSIEQRLDPARFVRVHRSHLVRVDVVVSIRRTLHGGAELVLRSGDAVPVGRHYASEARRRLAAPRSAGAS